MSEPVDSREYIFIFELRTNEDIPADFPESIKTLRFESGIFLPQDDLKRFRRPPRYPARLLLLQQRTITIVPHPTSEENPIAIELDNLE